MKMAEAMLNKHKQTNIKVIQIVCLKANLHVEQQVIKQTKTWTRVRPWVSKQAALSC